MNKNTEIIKTEKILDELTQKLERDPSPEDLAEYLEIPIKEVNDLLNLVNTNTY